MCISIPSLPVTCKGQQMYVFQADSGDIICGYRALAKFDSGISTFAFVVHSEMIDCITPEARVKCLAEWHSPQPVYRSLSFAAPTPVVSKVVERGDGSYVIGFPLCDVTETDGLAGECIKSLLHNPNSHGLQRSLFGEVFEPPTTEAEFDQIFQADSVRAFCCELLDALLGMWTPGEGQGLVFVVPAKDDKDDKDDKDPRRDQPEQPPDSDVYQDQEAPLEFFGDLEQHSPYTHPFSSLDIMVVFKLPRTATRVPMLGMQHNHSEAELLTAPHHHRNRPEAYDFVTNIPAIIGQLHVKLAPCEGHWYRQLPEHEQNALAEAVGEVHGVKISTGEIGCFDLRDHLGAKSELSNTIAFPLKGVAVSQRKYATLEGLE